MYVYALKCFAVPLCVYVCVCVCVCVCGVLVRDSVAVMKHHDQKQLGEERIYLTYSSMP